MRKVANLLAIEYVFLNPIKSNLNKDTTLKSRGSF